jgi:hypothetical protein
MILSDIPLLLWHLIALVILRVHGRTNIAEHPMLPGGGGMIITKPG